jgi:integrase
MAALASLRPEERAGRYVTVIHHKGLPISSNKKSFNTVRNRTGIGGDVLRHTLRHTKATWAMQAGVDLWEAAGALGMSVKTLEETYGHHHPNFQQNVKQI